LSVLLGLAAALFGIVAATYWYRSGVVPPDKREMHSTDVMYVQTMWLDSLTKASERSANLNKKAAVLTVVSVILSLGAAIFGAFA
jgi:hypothetical protein